MYTDCWRLGSDKMFWLCFKYGFSEGSFPMESHELFKKIPTWYILDKSDLKKTENTVVKSSEIPKYGPKSKMKIF